MILQPPQTNVTTPLISTNPPSRLDYGMGALIFAFITTIIAASCGCFWALPCTGVAIALGVTVSIAGWLAGSSIQCSLVPRCLPLSRPYNAGGKEMGGGGAEFVWAGSERKAWQGPISAYHIYHNSGNRVFV